MDKFKAAAKKAAMASVIEQGSSTEAPSSVMVAVRCRPFNTRETTQEEAKIVIIKENGYAALKPPEEGAPLREFSFDYTYDDDSIQETVYQNLGAPLLNKAFGGWNGTIFAYGQTGAGKSFSMTGAPKAGLPGIIPQMNAEMFERIVASTEANPGKKFLVTCSFMEIYNEVLYDLLDPTATRGTAKSRKDSHIDVKEDPKLGVYVAGLQEIGVDSKEKIEALMDQGNSARAVASTQMNATSSRSHSIFIIRLQQKEVVEGQQKDVRATINLVDLAGSERAAKTGATGDKLKEGANINKSLSALGNVINALAEQSKKPGKKVFIPYRNSKLTRVLQESLGGNSVTVSALAHRVQGGRRGGGGGGKGGGGRSMRARLPLASDPPYIALHHLMASAFSPTLTPHPSSLTPHPSPLTLDPSPLTPQPSPYERSRSCWRPSLRP